MAEQIKAIDAEIKRRALAGDQEAIKAAQQLGIGLEQPSGATDTQINAEIRRRAKAGDAEAIEALPEIQDFEKTEELLGVLGDWKPNQATYIPSTFGSGIGTSRTQMAQRSQAHQQMVGKRKQQENAFSELIGMGYEPEQIQNYHKVMKALEPSFLKEKGGQTVGATVGSIAGAALGNAIPGLAFVPFDEMITVPLGATIGAAIGGGAGKGIQQGLDPYQDVSAKDILMASGEEALWELGMRGAGKGLKLLKKGGGKLLKKIGKQPTSQIKADMKLFADMVGGVYPPREASKGVITDVVEGTVRGSMGGEQIFSIMTKANEKKHRLLSRKIVRSIFGDKATTSPTKAGQQFFDQISRKRMRIHGALGQPLDSGLGNMLKEVENVVSPLYDKFDDLTKGVGFNSSPLKKWADDVLVFNDSTHFIKPSDATKVAGLKDLPDGISSALYREKRSQMLGMLRKISPKDPDDYRRLAGLIDEFDNILYQAEQARAIPENARAVLKEANGIYRASAIFMESPAFKYEMARIIKDYPEQALAKLFPMSGKMDSGALQQIKVLKEGLIYDTGYYSALRAGKPVGKLVKSVEGEAAWDSLRSAWLTQQMKSGTLQKSLDKLGPAAKEMFDADTLNLLRRYDRIGDAIKPKGGLGGATLAVRSAQLGQLGAGTGLVLYGGATENKVALGIGGLLLVGPGTYAYLATKGKIGRAYVREIAEHNVKVSLGKKTAKDSVPVIATRLTRYLMDEDKKEINAIDKERKKKAQIQRMMEYKPRRVPVKKQVQPYKQSMGSFR